MANIKEPEDPGFPSVYLIKPGDDVEGGENGISNIQAKQLVERTAYLKEKLEAIDLEGSSGGGTGEGGGGTSEGGGETPETPPQPVAFIGLTANGSIAVTTTTLTLLFDQDIDGLNVGDIIVNALGTGAQKGVLTRTGMGSYALTINGVVNEGNIMVFVSKVGYSITGSPGMVSIYFSPPIVPLGINPRNLALIILGREVTNAADVTTIITVVSNTIRTGNINNLVIGDYFGLESISIAAGSDAGGAFSASLGNVTDKFGSYGRNLDFVLVAKNPYLGKNGNSKPHVFFHSRHVLSNMAKNGSAFSGGHYMNPTNTNVGGYLGSKGRQFVTTQVRAALIASGIPLDDSTKCPNISRRVSGNSGGGGATLTDIITDNVTLLTEYEMNGTHDRSSQTYEPATGQTHFSEYYTDKESKQKRNQADGLIMYYWSASLAQQSLNQWTYMYGAIGGVNSSLTASDSGLGIAPAFTVG
jgi:hypothetical protein